MLRVSEREFKSLITSGQHEVVVNRNNNFVSRSSKLQDAFYHSWVAMGGERDYWQVEYKFHPERRWRFDFANPDHKVAVEVNGGQWGVSGHSSGSGLQRDAEKLNAAQALGWKVFVLTTSMLSKRSYRESVGGILDYVRGSHHLLHG